MGFKHAFETSANPSVKEGSLYYIIRILVEFRNYTEAARVLTMLRTTYPRSSYVSLASRVYADRR